jgi:hypothetical protein
LTLVANTYGRKVGGRIWQDHLNMLLVGPPIHTKRPNTKADMWCNLKSTTELFPDSVEKGMPEGGAFDSPKGYTPAPMRCTLSKSHERSRQRTKQSCCAWLSLPR